MGVMKSWIGGKTFLQVPPVNELGTEMVRAVTECIAVNSTATLEIRRTEDTDIVSVLGNKTEGALLMLSRYMGVEYEQVRRRLGRLHFNTMTSERKRMSVLVNNINASGLKTQAKRLYVTGAAEVVLRLCEHKLNVSGTSTTQLTEADRCEPLQLHVWLCP
jgi:magnesium-transporting ATPase (P-type)